MRTTIDIKDDLMLYAQRLATEEHRSFKDMLNEILALGLNRKIGRQPAWECKTHDMGSNVIDYSKAWSMIDVMEQDAVAEKLDLRK